MIKSGQRFRAPALASNTPTIDGVVLVDKPAGPTSHDIVDQIRRHFRIAKVGHGGTLDPAATGLLVILVGKGTKLSNTFLGSDKAYEGTMKLGEDTNTYDAEGTVTETGDASAITEEAVKLAMKKFTGDIMQMPPMTSAVKVNGVPLYKSARKGIEVERKPRLIHIYEFTLKRFENPLAEFAVRCTKGTYVRSLCHDIGQDLHCCAHLKSLNRTKSGEFELKDAIKYDDMMNMHVDDFINILIPLRQFMSSGTLAK